MRYLPSSKLQQQNVKPSLIYCCKVLFSVKNKVSRQFFSEILELNNFKVLVAMILDVFVGFYIVDLLWICQQVRVYKSVGN